MGSCLTWIQVVSGGLQGNSFAFFGIIRIPYHQPPKSLHFFIVS